MILDFTLQARAFAREHYDLIFSKAKENDISLFEAVVLIFCDDEFCKTLSFRFGKHFCDLVLVEILNLSK